MYADDSAITVQEAAEEKLSRTLVIMENNSVAYHLKTNLNKTNICTFHLRNKQANSKLTVTWKGEKLIHCGTPTFLGATLDRTLTYMQLIVKRSVKKSVYQ